MRFKKLLKADKENMTTYDFNFHKDTIDNDVLEQIDYLTSEIKKEFTEYVKSGNGTEQDYDNLLLLLSRAYKAIKKVSK